MDREDREIILYAGDRLALILEAYDDLDNFVSSAPFVPQAVRQSLVRLDQKIDDLSEIANGNVNYQLSANRVAGLVDSIETSMNGIRRVLLAMTRGPQGYESP